jgi:hypothetical protein
VPNSESLNVRGVTVLRMPRPKTLDEPRDPALARYVFERLRACPETGRAISKRTKVAPATISNIRTGRGTYGVGRGVATDLLPFLGHRTYEELLSAAHAVTRDPPASSAALEELLARHPGRWSEAAIAAVRTVRFPSEPGEHVWTIYLDALEGVLRAIGAQHPTGDPLSAIERKPKRKPRP